MWAWWQLRRVHMVWTDVAKAAEEEAACDNLVGRDLGVELNLYLPHVWVWNYRIEFFCARTSHASGIFLRVFSVFRVIVACIAYNACVCKTSIIAMRKFDAVWS